MNEAGLNDAGMNEAGMSEAEFSRPFDVRQVEGRTVTLLAEPAECAALARRFDLVRIDRLAAEVLLARSGEAVTATGTLAAAIVQSCAVSAEDLAVAIDEPIALRFVPAASHAVPDLEIELDASDADEIEFIGSTFDLGEAVAQTLALAIDPFAVGPEADAVRRGGALASPQDSGPFAALAKLRKG